MEFLLKSHKKNRNWVWLKQLFLLLSRIGALLLALFMLGQVGCNEDRIARLLGSETTHHYVLLDDSFSMSDRGSAGSVFDKAQSTLSLIAARARNRQNQKFTLVRFSKAATADADINGELVDNAFAQRIEDVKARLKVSSLSVGAGNAVDSVAALIQERTDENAIVYILSDFRKKDWANPAEIEAAMTQIHDSGAAIELISCAKSVRPNLAVTELVAAGNVRVAGTPLMMRVSVKNCSENTAEKIQIKVETQAYEDAVDASIGLDELQPTIDELPTVFIEKIEAGETETREFPVYFSVVGQHVVKAQLVDDSVLVDNEQRAVTQVNSAAQVLIIDNAEQVHGGILALAMNPGGMTGIAPSIRTPNFLRDAPLDQLTQFDVIYLLDIERLDETAIKNLEAFAFSGGGVGFFLGPRTDSGFVTSQLYRNGNGVFPIPLEKAVAIPELVEERVPDVAPVTSPIFPDGMKNPLLDLVQIATVVQPPLEWVGQRSNDVTVAATIRGDETKPLVVQSRFGKGNVVVFTTTAGPVWNNWGRNGTFPPIMLLVEDWLASGRYKSDSNLVGVPIEISAPTKMYDPQVTFVVPADPGSSDNVVKRVTIKRRMEFNETGDQYQITLGSPDSNQSSDVNNPGIYEVWLRPSNDQMESKRMALNVDTMESEMELVNREKLLGALGSSKPSMVNWDQFNPEPKQENVSSLSKLLLFALLALLAIEQWLAYSTSYHR